MKFQHVAVSVSDIEASLQFYRDTLGFPYLGRLNYNNDRGLLIDFLDMGGGRLLELFSFSVPTKSPHWIDDDSQRGLRHIGFVVESVDQKFQELREQNVEFKTEPFDAHGGVRIAFFYDPDGTLLELVEGKLVFDRAYDASYPARTPQVLANGLEFDHVAITVSNLEDATAFYASNFDAQPVGDLIFQDDRGFHIRYSAVGDTVLEFFGFDSTIENRWDPDETVLGLKHLGFEVVDVFDAHRNITQRLHNEIYPANHALGEVDTAFVADPDGNALEYISGTCVYDR